MPERIESKFCARGGAQLTVKTIGQPLGRRNYPAKNFTFDGNAFRGENKRPGYPGRRYHPSLYARGEYADLLIAGTVNRANGDLCRHRHCHCDDVRNRQDQRRFP